MFSRTRLQSHGTPRPEVRTARATLGLVWLQMLLNLSCGTESAPAGYPQADGGFPRGADGRPSATEDLATDASPAADSPLADGAGRLDAHPMDLQLGPELDDRPDTAKAPDSETPTDLGTAADAGLLPDMAPDMAPDLGPPPPPPNIVQILPWPGGGLQVVVELPPEQNAPELWPEVQVVSPLALPVDSVVRSARVTTGLTVILLVPAEDPGEHLLRRAVADVLLDSLPAGERVALLMVGEDLLLLAEPSMSREHARSQMARFRPEAGRVAAPMIHSARSKLDDLESRFTTLGRTLIVVGEDVEETPPGEPRPVQTLSIATFVDPAADAAGLLTQHRARRAAIVRVGACLGLAKDEVFSLQFGAQSLMLEAPAPMNHLAGEACDANAAAADAYPFPTEISLTFSPDERLVFDARTAAVSIEPFTTSVRLGVGLPIPAVAHFHGMGTLGCERKSITVELEGGRRRLAQDLAADRFILISMCQDLRYFGQVFANRVLSALGLFSSPFKYVRLRIDGVNRGVYMMVYQPERAFRDTSLGLMSVVRRGYDIDQWLAEVKYPADPVEAEDARLRFESIGDLALSEAPESLEAVLDGRLELDGYLRLLAVFSLVENGDFIDEVFFASSLQSDGERYRVVAWDTDDLWSACHAGGARAIVDPCGVTYCTESELDQSLLRSTQVYRRYLDVLTNVLETLSADRLMATMADVQAELFGVLDDDETAAACTEMVSENPALSTVAAAQADISAFMEAGLAQTERRRTALFEALAVCPEASP